MKMKKTCWMMGVVLAGALSSAAMAQEGREFRKTVELSPGSALRFNTDKGSVRLTAWDEPRVEVQARIVPGEGTSDEYGRRTVEAARIEVTGDAGTLTIRSDFSDVPTEQKAYGTSRNIPNIHYEIRAPRRLDLSLEVDRTRVEIAGFNGKTTLQADRTPVELRDLSGEIHLRIDRGEAKLAGVRGTLEIKSDRTVVTVDSAGIEGDSLFDISRGDLNLSVPASQPAQVSARIGKREEFRSDFPVSARSANNDLIEGAINGGGPRLTFQGDRSRMRLLKGGR
jgi:hypothetical protein